MIIERTLVLAKTDVLERGLLGRILQRFEDAGLKVVAAKLKQANTTLAKKHYTGSKKWKVRIGNKVVEEFKDQHMSMREALGTDNPERIGENVYKRSVEYLIKNPVLAMVIEGPHAIERVNQMAGHTEPRKALRGTIRADFSTDSILLSNMQKRAIYNLVHTSRDRKSAAREIKIWFNQKEIVNYKNVFEKTSAHK